MSVDEKSRSGYSSNTQTDENVDKIRKLVLTNHFQIIDKTSEINVVSYSSVYRN